MSSDPNKKKKRKGLFQRWRKGKQSKHRKEESLQESKGTSVEEHQNPLLTSEVGTSPSLLVKRRTLQALALELHSEEGDLQKSSMSDVSSAGALTSPSPTLAKLSQEEKKLRLHASALKARERIQKRRERAIAQNLGKSLGETGSEGEKLPLVQGSGGEQSQTEKSRCCGCCCIS